MIRPNYELVMNWNCEFLGEKGHGTGSAEKVQQAAVLDSVLGEKTPFQQPAGDEQEQPAPEQAQDGAAPPVQGGQDRQAEGQVQAALAVAATMPSFTDF